MPICKLCGQDKELSKKAHIIPKKLYNLIREASSDAPPGDQSPWIYPVGTGQKSQQTQSGIHDDSILCKTCDNSLIWDNYGQTFLLNLPNPKIYTDNLGQPAFYEFDTFDYQKLKLFFMSILWRAAITSEKFFDKVKLGSWEEKLKKMILEKNPGTENDFSVILWKYEGDFSECMSNPNKNRVDGINYYRFRLPRYGFLIKVDQRKCPTELTPWILNPNLPLRMRVKKYTESEDYKQLFNVKGKLSN